MTLHINTPLIESEPISRAAGRRIRLKLDILQPPGSFKIRGIGLACARYAQQGKQRFVASSGGNAGIAVAHAGRHLGIAVVVVVPESTPEAARERIRRQGAQLIVHGAAWHEANALAQSLLTETDAFIHPFDAPLLWQGHASLIDELAASTAAPDAILLSVGGGGLFCGAVEGLRRNGWGHVPVITAETDGADAFARSLAAGRRVALEHITSVASSLAAKQVCEQAFQLGQAHPTRPAVVSDTEALLACQRFLDDHRLLVEPACGASLALAYDQAGVLAGLHDIIVVVCGGVIIPPVQASQGIAPQHAAPPPAYEQPGTADIGSAA
ncbi:pyridoxal-phosphate dependent enzyme [Kerstersia gyiorum]|uniref:pyridoxal-phosphate dependent enzyme n=1 Tax=Kerstersia gyiorum TaxID=206506 RepID=UPI00209EFE4B|nr:pyridoxal-phosphate dependent enzyme [Kerstersia gyiorum]MCP1633158.1 L-serine/L-threonine ammonia-lyase [Kerstersia gyiorum]MCP1670352.1 L-serine/L-threonine ammonia-lyase [Kerstersia gyiorum]MCP1682677.1 L-serine/L-threonine ammonia-lyase [Kerstersia gyiorum]MCP1708259.1 L-serine/L-threonine ammonia-lyase [Kerstersia gyiorum]MCP1718182.1 L-serine/L-threonine ammonia-lyase [Kerstersia gyiorum]